MLSLVLLVPVALAFRANHEIEEHLPDKTYIYMTEKSESVRETLLKGLGCYCREVSSMEECPDFKATRTHEVPERERFFHFEVSPGSEKPHRCCKFSSTAWHNRVGSGYERQPTEVLCFGDVRPTDAAGAKGACCRVGDKGKVAVRVKRVKAAAYQLREGDHILYGKSYPFVTSEDIAGGTDYDNNELNPEQVMQILQHARTAASFNPEGDQKLAGEGEDFTCSKFFTELMEDTGSCKVRTKAPAECCCHKAALQSAERCLSLGTAASAGKPSWSRVLADSATENPEHPTVVVNGSYSEEKYPYRDGTDRFLHFGKIKWGETPEDGEKGLPILQRQDPEATGHDLEFMWTPVETQWKATCLEMRKVGYVKTHRHHDKDASDACISKEYKRICPQGQALYVKNIAPGTCSKPEGQGSELPLTEIGSGGLTYQCPKGYRSGTKGGVNFDPRCRCEDSC